MLWEIAEYVKGDCNCVPGSGRSLVQSSPTYDVCLCVCECVSVSLSVIMRNNNLYTYSE